MPNARIIVKFRPGIDVPYIDSAHLALPASVAEAWQSLVNLFPDALISLNRLISSQTGSQLEQLINSARNFSGQEPPNLLSIMAIDVQGGVDKQALLNVIKGFPFIEFAYEETELSQPTVDPSNDPLSTFQGYLNVAPFGIEAFTAWNQSGSDGSNVRFLDIERGWNLSHEDIVGAGITELNASVPGNEFHSTACLGIVLAQDNDKGIIGLAPKVKGAIASSLRPTLADAFTLAVGFLQAGDILLIEEQTFDGKPVEQDSHLALLIRTLTLLGIVVVEPAGNGFNGIGHDLNLGLRADGTSFDRNTPLFFDSGAIMVGARQAIAGRSRMPFSCFGNRVDCHCWGENIVTTSSITSPFGSYIGLNPAGGDFGFGGTSGASAIIAGAALILQGIAKNQGKLITPSKMRSLLSDSFNTSSDVPSIDQIGVMPNLKEAILRI